ncbi:hypothetical protein H072_6394 [Dactylellina haptotyla CBS 200.50]|uniref:Conjugal transfer protein TraX n=1 Tax=Dactylellina haptotyla (strain CBS 200.50) TaxID=1284197 RepID=S8BKB7_DACHA|nr:hypothetical protein H072_6394 [Dactylellina haptotyla CBS 200.50]
MTGDHINKYLFNEELPILFEAGRIAMPLFTLVLAYNLARPNANASGAYSRMTTRLALFGLISSVPFVGLEILFWGWYPLNIFFTLLVVTLVVRLVEQARSRGSILVGLGALAAFVVGGGLVEFWWPAVTIGLGAWLYFKSGNLLGLGASMASCASLWYINGNFWALAAYPLLILLSRINVQAPRLRWFFYGYYPAHLLAIYLIRIPMARAGYEFY